MAPPSMDAPAVRWLQGGAAARRREAHALAQRDYRARHYEQESLRERLIDYHRASPLQWRASDHGMALFAGKHQTPWGVETPGDSEAWVVCCEGHQVVAGAPMGRRRWMSPRSSTDPTL